MLLISVLTAAVLAAPLPERGNLNGEVAIERSTSAIAVYVDTDRDAAFDRRFLLSFERHDHVAATKIEHGLDFDEAVVESTMPTRKYFDSATVEFAAGYVRVVGAGEAFELFVEGTQTAEWNPAGARVWRWAGHGLSHTAVESNLAVKRSRPDRSVTAEWCDASTDCDGGDTDGGGGTTPGGSGTVLCDAGGFGSSSCSVTNPNGGGSCSVTCTSGYYACCNAALPYPKCKCIR